MAYKTHKTQKTAIPAVETFHDENAARTWLEAQRWPDGPVCPHCGVFTNITRLQGESHRPGLYQCNECRQHFTVTVGTLFESSHVPLHKWLLAMHLMTSSKKGISAHQLHRTLRVAYRTAWFMAHRIREAMRDYNPTPMGGIGGIVRADETYFGTKDALRGKSWGEKKGHSNKMAVISLISDGKARTFHAEKATTKTVYQILSTHANLKSQLQTDERPIYNKIGAQFALHHTVNHSKEEYVRDGVHVNTVENYFSVFKRGMRGVYQHCSEKHLQRYLCEFDFRYNHRAANGFDDWGRYVIAVKGIEGKRLTYRRARSRALAQGRSPRPYGVG